MIDVGVREDTATGRLRAYAEANLAHLRTHRPEMAALLALRLGPGSTTSAPGSTPRCWTR